MQLKAQQEAADQRLADAEREAQSGANQASARLTELAGERDEGTVPLPNCKQPMASYRSGPMRCNPATKT